MHAAGARTASANHHAKNDRMGERNGMDRYQRENLLKDVFPALLIAPAVFLGVLAMILGGVSPAMWGQQAAAWLVFALLAPALRRAAGRVRDAVWCLLFVMILAAALFGPEAGGARRWVNLFVFRVNTAQLVLPALLIVLCRVKCPYPALMAAAAVLCVQPSLAQLTAFSAAALALFWRGGHKRIWGIASALVLVLLVIACRQIPVALEPVLYCEGILSMLGDVSWLLLAAGLLSLAAVPAFFLHRFCVKRETQALCLSVYYAVSLLFVLTGEYPVPFMGFGLSPIAGYFLATSCVRCE